MKCPHALPGLLTAPPNARPGADADTAGPHDRFVVYLGPQERKMLLSLAAVAGIDLAEALSRLIAEALG